MQVDDADLHVIRDLLLKARCLRALIRHSDVQRRRDDAIVDYTRALDDLLEQMLAMYDRGDLGPEGFDAEKLSQVPVCGGCDDPPTEP